MSGKTSKSSSGSSGAARPRPKPTPQVHNGQPANGKHVPSAATDHPGPFDYSGAVGSNVTGVPGPAQASDEVLAAPPWEASYPTQGLTQSPMY